MPVTKRTWKRVYKRLDRVSPVPYDCGILCGKACCGGSTENEIKRTSVQDLGIFLFPGEEAVQREDPDWLLWSEGGAEEWGFPYSWRAEPVHCVCCKDPSDCHRSQRSLQCRTFPVFPHLREDGTMGLIYNDLELPYDCPLIREEVPLDPVFLKTTYRVWKRLLRDPRIHDLVAMESDNRRPEFSEDQILYPED